MGQPIKLFKGNEVMTVYGRAQAAVHIADGWMLESEHVAAEIVPTPKPVPEPAPKPAPKKPSAPAKKTAVTKRTRTRKPKAA